MRIFNFSQLFRKWVILVIPYLSMYACNECDSEAPNLSSYKKKPENEKVNERDEMHSALKDFIKQTVFGEASDLVSEVEELVPVGSEKEITNVLKLLKPEGYDLSQLYIDSGISYLVRKNDSGANSGYRGANLMVYSPYSIVVGKGIKADTLIIRALKNDTSFKYIKGSAKLFYIFKNGSNVFETKTFIPDMSVGDNDIQNCLEDQLKLWY